MVLRPKSLLVEIFYGVVSHRLTTAREIPEDCKLVINEVLKEQIKAREALETRSSWVLSFFTYIVEDLCALGGLNNARDSGAEPLIRCMPTNVDPNMALEESQSEIKGICVWRQDEESRIGPQGS
jgi:hypothetical protein